jgi:hypothetical protein
VAQRHAWAFNATLLCARVNGSNCATLGGAAAVPPQRGLAGAWAVRERASPFVTGLTATGLDDVASIFSINGALYRGDGAPALRAVAGEVHEWTLSAGWIAAHVIHLHAVPFQLVAYEPAPGVGGRSARSNAANYMVGQWMDSVLVPAGGRVVVRLRFVDEGPTLLHCHVLLHHDVGMAAVVDVQAAAGER